MEEETGRKLGLGSYGLSSFPRFLCYLLPSCRPSLSSLRSSATPYVVSEPEVKAEGRVADQAEQKVRDTCKE